MLIGFHLRLSVAHKWFFSVGKYPMKPALVTGASGFLGWHVARVLLERGYRVRALVRPGSRVDVLDVECVTGDLRDPASLQRAVAGCGLLFHVAADYRLWAKDTGFPLLYTRGAIEKATEMKILLAPAK